MNCPAVCLSDSTDFKQTACHFLTDRKFLIGSFGNIHGSQYPTYKNQIDRQEKVTDWVISKIGTPDLVILEGYSLGSKGLIFNIAEMTGLLKYKMWKKGIHLIVVPPTKIKKDATSKGNANKEAMYAAFLSKTKFDLKKHLANKSTKTISPISDIVDAYFMCCYGINNQKTLIAGKPSY